MKIIIITKEVRFSVSFITLYNVNIKNVGNNNEKFIFLGFR